MPTIPGGFVSVLTGGFWKDDPVPPALAICEVEFDSLAATSVQVKITKVGASVTRMKVGYRIRKQSDADDLVFTATKVDPAVDQTFNITGLTENILYEFIPYATDADGEFDQPGPIILVTPSAGGWREVTCNTIRTRFKVNVEEVVSGLVVQYDNEDTNPPDDNTRWVRLAIKLGMSRQVSMGAVPRHRAVGTMIASIFVPGSMGDQSALQLSDIIEINFRGAKQNGVVFQTPTTEQLGKVQDHWQVNVTCPFYVDLIE